MACFRNVRALGAVLLCSGLWGCDEERCPPSSPAAVELTIENGAYAGECLYHVTASGPDGRVTPDCTASSATDCLCTLGVEPGDYQLELQVSVGPGLFDVDELEVSVFAADDACARLETEHIHYAAVPAQELARPACEAAQAQLASCKLEAQPDCVQEGLALRALGGTLGQLVDCLDECISARSCDELLHDYCAPQDKVTDYERCQIACGGGSEGDVNHYAPEIGLEQCPPGGAGGAGGADTRETRED